MTWSETAVLVGALVALALWWAWVAASRLDRLHRKVESSRAVLDAQLVRRASAAAELASSGLMDPVSSVLVGEAAWSALAAGGRGDDELVRLLPDLAELATEPGIVRTASDPEERGLAESELSSTLRAALDDPDEVEDLRAEPGGAELVDALAAGWYRVQLARRFHNEAVAQAQRVRRGWGVRTFRLAGRAPVPSTVDLDDAWPEALGRPVPPARTPSGGPPPAV